METADLLKEMVQVWSRDEGDDDEEGDDDDD